ncbi:hypothetical protein ASA1KI_40650 [Opitutales bacterium ASA1]|nr:hypothetical protein ASA1KI_40650 [Opitutales bacterium ASA1]
MGEVGLVKVRDESVYGIVVSIEVIVRCMALYLPTEQGNVVTFDRSASDFMDLVSKCGYIRKIETGFVVGGSLNLASVRSRPSWAKFGVDDATSWIVDHFVDHGYNGWLTDNGGNLGIDRDEVPDLIALLIEEGYDVRFGGYGRDLSIRRRQEEPVRDGERRRGRRV